ncbi:hypothetical protein [Salinimicrobium sp. GXAS 041]|uniref:hypothetical protein n=1 Tax=Salinimicrobium sp. GXAS 041 TaxID=3400806 RepID=UPI003C7433C9
MQFRILHYESFKPLAELSKYEHMWSFFGRSYNYNLFIGLTEFLIGILIVFRRTRLIALLISLGVCINILILNIEFEIYFAIQHITLDLALTLLLLTGYRKDLYQFFIQFGGRFKKNFHTPRKRFVRILPFLYIILLPVGYFIFAYKMRAGVSEELVGSYKIEGIRLGNNGLELEKGSLGSSPMMFLEYNNQAVLSMNDSIYFGAYSAENGKIQMYFNPPADHRISSIKGNLKDDLLKGSMNDSIPVEMKIKRLPAQKDYLNELYQK